MRVSVYEKLLGDIAVEIDTVSNNLFDITTELNKAIKLLEKMQKEKKIFKELSF